MIKLESTETIEKLDLSRFIKTERINVKVLSADFASKTKRCQFINCAEFFVPPKNQVTVKCPKCEKKQRIVDLVAKKEGTIDVEVDGLQKQIVVEIAVVEALLGKSDSDVMEDQLMEARDVILTVQNDEVVAIEKCSVQMDQVPS